MASKSVQQLVDDIDGTDAALTVEFGIDGETYEIDLSARNAARLRSQVGAWARQGRVVAGAAAGGAVHVAMDADPAVVRRWAEARRIPVPPRGKLPAEVLELFRRDEAHGMQTRRATQALDVRGA